LLSVELCDEVANVVGKIRALVLVGVSRRESGDVAAAIATMEHALTLAVDIASATLQAAALVALGGAYTRVGRVAEAADPLTRAHELFTGSGHASGQCQSLIARAALDLAAGRPLGEAASGLGAALEIADEIGSPFLRARALEQLAEVRFAEGRPEDG